MAGPPAGYEEVPAPGVSGPPPGYEEVAPPQMQKPPEPGMLDKQIPLTSYGNATLSGIQSVGRGARDAVTGVGHMIAHPIDTLSGMADLPSQAAQVPKAIGDINQSADPLGTYAKVAQETAGQGAGQAGVALATEGLSKGVGSVARNADLGDLPLKAKAIGKVGAQDVASHIPVAGRLLRRPSIGDYVEAAKTKSPPTFPSAPLGPPSPPPELLQAGALAKAGQAPPAPPGAELATLPAQKIAAPAPLGVGTSSDIHAPLGIARPETAPITPTINPDILEDRGIQQNMRENIDEHQIQYGKEKGQELKRQYSMDKPKGEQIRDFRNAQADALQQKAVDVRSGKKTIASPKPGTVIPQPGQDLTDLLQQSLKKAKKGQR